MSVRAIAHHTLMQAGGLWMHVRRTRAPAVMRRVVLIRPDHLGDVLLLTPALARLRTALPAVAVTVQVGPWACPVAQQGPAGVTVEALAFPGFTRGPKPHPLRPYVDLWFAARHLRHEGYDAALILRDDHWWGGGAAAMGMIPIVLGFDHPATRPALTDRLPWTPRAHAARTNLVLVEALIARATGQPPRPLPADDCDLIRQHPLVFRVPEAARRRAAALLDGLGPGTPLVAINPGAGAAVKRWLPERWARVADALAAAHGAAILLTGGPGEEALTAAVAAAMERPALDLAGRTDFPTLGALYERCALVLGPDCGSLHLAVAVGTPSIHLYGPADARQFGPWGDPARHVVVAADRADIPCLGCGDLSPERPAAPPCLTILDTATVLSVAERLLESAVPV